MEEIVKKFFSNEDWKFFDDGKTAVSQTSKFTIRKLNCGDFIGTLKIPASFYAEHFYEVTIQDVSLEFVCQRFLEWGQCRTVDHDDWIDQAIALFGDKHLDWRFKCPKCGQSQSIGECHKWGMTGLQPMQLCGNCGHCIPPINPVVIETKVRNHYERTYVFEFDRSNNGNKRPNGYGQ